MTDPARDLTVSPTTATVVEAVVNIDRVSAVEIERVRQQGDLKRLQMNLAAWES